MKEQIKQKQEQVMEELSQIDLWKKEYGKVFMTTVGDTDYIWRRIKRSEYSNIMSVNEGDTVDERIYNKQILIAKTVVLNYPEAQMEVFIDEYAGLPTVLSEEVLDKSGFNVKATIEL